MITLLGGVDAAALQWLQDVAAQDAWAARLGMLCLPFVWALVASVARGADDGSQTWSAFAGFAHRRLWMGVLASGAVLVAFDALIHLTSFLVLSALEPAPVINRSADLVHTLGGQVAFFYWLFGVCLLPLLVLQPGLSPVHARDLSLRAVAINGRRPFDELVVVALLIGLPLHFIPASGLGEVVWVVFTGTLNYVAYRDIFERRAENLLELVLGPAVPAVQRTPVLPNGHRMLLSAH
jgi:hypothetical protein